MQRIGRAFWASSVLFLASGQMPGGNFLNVVVFREAGASESVLSSRKEGRSMAIDGSWDIAFQPGRGAEQGIRVNKLQSWTEEGDAGVKYFSGTATYTKTITLPAAFRGQSEEVWIDLGDVKNIAEVIVNGRPQRILWRAPFRAEISGALKTGGNKIEIKVTNLWVNRLIGDQQPGVTKKITYTTTAFYTGDAPLLPSGLMGPVRIYTMK